MACLSLNDQAFIFITMTFPSFITTGGTVDIPTVPLERKALDLTPLIQQLMMNKKASPSSTSSDKKDKKDPDIKGTIGQTEQWFDNYQRNQSEIQNLINWYGPELAVKQPEYRRLISEQDEISNPAIVARLANNKERLDAYDATVKEKGASGMINMDMLGRTGVGMAHSDWSHLMQYAQINSGLKVTDPGAFAWMENFSYTPYIATFDDALAALDKRFSHIGTSEYSSGGGSDSVYEDIKDNWVYLVSEHNTSMATKKSNNSIYGENPTGIGQLDAAKREALSQAFSSFMGNVEGDDLASGLANKFLLKTAATISAKKIGLPGNNSVKAILQTKAYGDKFIGEEPTASDFAGDDGKIDKTEQEAYKKAYEEWALKNKEAGQNYSKTHDGYYWKAGQKDKDNKDIGGFLDEEALLGDYERFVTEIVDAEHNKRLITVDNYKQDQTKTLSLLDTQQERYNAKLDAEQEVVAANQQDYTVSTVGNIGILENDLQKLFNGDEDYTTIDALFDFFKDPSKFDVIAEKWRGKLSDTDIDEMTYSGISPFVINQTQDGKRTYMPNPNFTGENIEMYNESQKTYAIEQLKMSNEEAESYAKNQTEKAIKAHKTLADNMLAKGQQGNVVFDGTKSVVVTADTGFLDYTEKSWFDGSGEKKIGKTGEALFTNQLSQIGMTVTDGGSFFGNAFRYAGIEEGYSYVNLGLANNAGAKAKYPMTINGHQYEAGEFIHLSVVDQMTKEQLADFNSKVDYGSNGYWNIEGNKATKNGKPNKTGRVYGSGTNSENILLSLNATGGPNAIAESPTSIMANVDMIGKKEEVIKHWKDKGTTLAREVPTFVKGNEKREALWNEAEKASNYHNINRESEDKAIEKTAEKLNIKKGTRAYTELEKIKGKGSYERANKIVDAIAIRDNVSGYASWDRRKTSVNETIVDGSGNVKDFAKQQLYLREEKNSNGDILYKVKAGVEVQAQMAVSDKIKTGQRLTVYNNSRMQKLNPTTEPKKEIKANPIIIQNK